MNTTTESGDQSSRTALPAGSVLVLMLKAPHRSKTRLATDIGPEAITVASHLAACTLEDARAWKGPVCMAPADMADLEWTLRHRATGWLVLPQSAGNLGERINHVNRRLEDDGMARQIFIGTDCPEMHQTYLEAADAALADCDAVLGAAADGGVVLMATRRRWPDLAQLPWSTPKLGQALAESLRESGWRLTWLPEKADVDSLSALQALHARLAADTRPARRALHAWLTDRRQENG